MPVMIFVGLMGGASYVNGFYQLLQTDLVENEKRELAVNICTMFNGVGITLASLFYLFVENYL